MRYEGVHLAEQARNILDAAESASRNGQACSEMTILIGPECRIRMGGGFGLAARIAGAPSRRAVGLPGK